MTSRFKEILEYTKFLDKDAPKKLRLYHWRHKINNIPKCIITGKSAYLSHRSGYQKVCEGIFDELVQFDKQIKTEPFKWLNLLIAGAGVDELISIKKTKKFHHVRNRFNNCNTLDDIKQRLQELKFLPHVIDKITSNLDFMNWETIKQFVEIFDKLMAAKNNTKEYYINRGYSETEAVRCVYEQCNYWPKLRVKLEFDEERRQRWLESRMAGIRASKSQSRFEKELIDGLSKIYDVKTSYEVTFTKIPKEYNAIINKKRFICDIVINNTHIIEYNGAFWHSDILEERYGFSINEYIMQIQEAKFLRYLTFKKIILLWEHDIQNDIDKAIDIIRQSIENNKIFNSSRKIDYYLYRFLLEGGTVAVDLLPEKYSFLWTSQRQPIKYLDFTTIDTKM